MSHNGPPRDRHRSSDMPEPMQLPRGIRVAQWSPGAAQTAQNRHNHQEPERDQFGSWGSPDEDGTSNHDCQGDCHRVGSDGKGGEERCEGDQCWDTGPALP